MCGTAGTVWVLTDGNVLVAGELPRQCPHCRRAHFGPRSALRAWDPGGGARRSMWERKTGRSAAGIRLSGASSREGVL
jgi:hypothetical protein